MTKLQIRMRQVDQVKDDPEFTSVGAGYLWYISPNIDAVPDLANLNLRKAMTFALDRDAIFTSTWNNFIFDSTV